MSDTELSEAATKSAIQSPTARFRLSWSGVASLFGFVLGSWVAAGIFLAGISVCANFVLVTFHVPDPGSIMVVFVPCVLIIILMLRGIARDGGRLQKVQQFLDKALAACSENVDFSVKMREFRMSCVANKSEETSYISAKFVEAINDLEPEVYRIQSSKIITLHNYVNEHEVFESHLPRLADQIVRIALLCTFAGIAFALITTAGQLEHINTADGGTQDAIGLVRKLIHAASFKFIISAVGLLCVILLRMISASSEASIRTRVSAIFAAFAERSAIFSSARQRGGAVKDNDRPVDLPKLLEQLTNQLEQNIHMREAAAVELARGFQEAASAIHVDFTGRFNEQLYERFSAVFGGMAQENRQALKDITGVLELMTKALTDLQNPKNAPAASKPQVDTNIEKSAGNAS